eukprot:1900847-Pleurochrysis_carterae.AAC.1
MHPRRLHPRSSSWSFSSAKTGGGIALNRLQRSASSSSRPRMVAIAGGSDSSWFSVKSSRCKEGNNSTPAGRLLSAFACSVSAHRLRSSAACAKWAMRLHPRSMPTMEPPWRRMNGGSVVRPLSLSLSTRSSAPSVSTALT